MAAVDRATTGYITDMHRNPVADALGPVQCIIGRLDPLLGRLYGHDTCACIAGDANTCRNTPSVLALPARQRTDLLLYTAGDLVGTFAICVLQGNSAPGVDMDQ